VIRATANNRFDTQLHRTVITRDAAPALAAPPDLIYRLALIAAAHKSLAARVARRADAIDRRGGRLQRSRDGGVAAATRLVSAVISEGGKTVRERADRRRP
jgi:hypothetical protein